MLDGSPLPTGETLSQLGVGRWAESQSWTYGYLFSQALTVGGGTGDVQRNIIAERVLGLPHDVDVEAGLTWAEARARDPRATTA